MLAEGKMSVYDVGNALNEEDVQREAKEKESALRGFHDKTLQECFAKLIFSLPTAKAIGDAISSSLITR
jgi:hypothetical protein